MHNIAVFNNIILALNVQFACIAYGSLRTQLHIIIVLDNLSADKALLKVGMDNTCALRSLPALAVPSFPRLLPGTLGNFPGCL